ncbi:MAG TPA: hypothetical protein VF138_10285 [Caulobacteraceae bacterium]
MKKFLLLGACALALGACKLEKTPQAGDQAELSAGAPFALMLAPAYEALPPAPRSVPVAYAPAPVAQQYWDDAYLTSADYYNQPPSYFNYAGATPLVWNAPNANGDLVTRIVEAVVGGGLREYFYDQGSDNPYFVRDPQYAYAYDDAGRLVAVYDPYGRPLSQSLAMQRVPYASRYLLRADNLRDAAVQAALVRLAPDVWQTQRTLLVRDLDDNDTERAWRTWWEAPGDNRSPVAVQRLAEVRARKAARDAAHDRWLADKQAGKAVAKLEDRHWKDDRKVGQGPRKDDHPGKNSGKSDDKPNKPEKQAKADDHGGGKGDHGKGGEGNGKKG